MESKKHDKIETENKGVVKSKNESMEFNQDENVSNQEFNDESNQEFNNIELEIEDEKSIEDKNPNNESIETFNQDEKSHQDNTSNPDEKTFKCSLCEKIFRTEPELIQHYGQCSEWFKNKLELETTKRQLAEVTLRAEKAERREAEAIRAGFHPEQTKRAMKREIKKESTIEIINIDD